MGECWVFDTFCYVGICRIKNYLMSEGNLIAWPGQFFLFTSRITRGRFKFERTRVSSLRISGFEKGEYAGELPRKFISFHCLENESNVPKDHNTERTENFPDLPQRSEVEIVVNEETETSPTKSLAVLQVTGGKETMFEERGNVDKECLVLSSQECLLSSSDEGSEGLEKFLRDKLESFGGEVIENTVEVDPPGVLDLLDANLMDRGNPRNGVVTFDDEIPRSRLDDILRSELREKIIGGGSKRPLCDVDIGVAINDLRRVLHLTLMMRVVDCFSER